jgi:hypothetical protein
VSGYADSWRYDVHEKCLKMGLDPDRDSHRELAARELEKESDARHAKRLLEEQKP